MYHVLPIDDIKDHEESTTCECCPSVEIKYGDMICIHNAFDRRELREQAIKDANGGWIPIKKCPLPRNGAILITMSVDGEKYTNVVYCDPEGLMDRFGERIDYMWRITHWMPLPEPSR